MYMFVLTLKVVRTLLVVGESLARALAHRSDQNSPVKIHSSPMNRN